MLAGGFWESQSAEPVAKSRMHMANDRNRYPWMRRQLRAVVLVSGIILLISAAIIVWNAPSERQAVAELQRRINELELAEIPANESALTRLHRQLANSEQTEHWIIMAAQLLRASLHALAIHALQTTLEECLLDVGNEERVANLLEWLRLFDLGL
jgi:hypothetical protein